LISPGWPDLLATVNVWVPARAEAQSGAHCVLVVSAGEDDDRQVFHAVQEIEAAATRHVHIEEQQLDVTGPQCGLGLKHIFRFRNYLNVAVFGEQSLQFAPCKPLVIDDQRLHEGVSVSPPPVP